MTSPAESPNPQPDMLTILRGQVDGLDEQIIALVSRRTELARAIGQEKQLRGETVMVTDRHTAVIGHYMEARPEDGPLSVQHAVRLGETVMEISREVQAQDRRDAEALYDQTIAEVAGTMIEPGEL